ncbi:MAG: bifunctional phosphoribosylaminoimidazolecarboxamide formyltransferase/IMP cyclohydrolase, partial [Acidimicrobiales bacterium]
MRALLSAYDKTGLPAFAAGLVDLGWDIVSSGGTARVLADHGIPHVTVEEVTGSPSMLGHRVVTLHPKLHGGLLADRSDPAHLADLERYGIEPIDLVAVNLYPFRSDPSIELIDIGGPAMVRAAAKNWAHVGVIVDPGDYGPVLDELRLGHGTLAEPTRRRLARTAFAHTAAYDAAIVTWFDDTDPDHAVLPPTLHLALERAGAPLRYGENPHQQGARYREVGGTSWWDGVTQHGGIALSYLNLFDADAAWQLVHDLGDRPAAAIIKHANPCGAAVAASIEDAYHLAFECDPMSAFGGIVALNRPVGLALAQELVANPKADVLIAPSFTDDALQLITTKKKNLRVLSAPAPERDHLELRRIGGGFLVQDADRFDAPRSAWKAVTDAQPTDAQLDDLELAWRICAYVKSNAIVFVKGGVAVGIGAGQQNRLDSGRIAAEKAAGRAAGGACASDAFFPFRDGLDAAAAAGITAVVQPGGSLRDDEV